VSKYIRIGVSALLLIVIAWRTNWSDVGARFANLNVEMWFLALALFTAAQFASARRWQLFARKLHFEHSLRQYTAYYFIGLYFNLILPTTVGGDVMRVWYLSGPSRRKWPALASVFLERLNGLVILIGAACLGALLSPVALPWWVAWSVWGSAGAALLGLALVPMLRHWERLPLQRRQQLQTLLELMGSPGILVEATFLSILVQAAGALILWSLGRGLGLDVPIAYYCIVGPMVTLLMMLPLSVNGMGVREGGMVLFLMPLGVDEATALSLAFLWFAVAAAVSLVGGVVYSFTNSKSEFRNTKQIQNPNKQCCEP
jgi:glycosyltransferase 2 family protein